MPIPTFPLFETIKLVAVEEPTTKAGPLIPLGLIDNNPQGLEEAMPTPPAGFNNRLPPALCKVKFEEYEIKLTLSNCELRLKVVPLKDNPVPAA